MRILCSAIMGRCESCKSHDWTLNTSNLFLSIHLLFPLPLGLLSHGSLSFGLNSQSIKLLLISLCGLVKFRCSKIKSNS